MALVEFLEEAQAKGQTTVAGLITAVNNGTCDSWQIFQSIDYMESLCRTQAGTIKLNRRR